MKGIAEKSMYHGDEGWESDLELFSEVAINPKQWLGTADEHVYVAKLLLPSILQWQDYSEKLMGYVSSVPVFPVSSSAYFFHCALAIENAFKAVIAINNKETIKSETERSAKIPKLVIGHKLTKLASAAGYKLDLDAEYILSFLTRYGIWGGKHPFPIRNSENNMTVTLSDGNHYLVGGYNPKNIQYFVGYSEKVSLWSREEVNKAMHPTSG